MAAHSPGGRLEEQLRTPGAVNEVVEASGAGRLPLARFLATFVSNSGGPNFLVVHWGQKLSFAKRYRPSALIDEFAGRFARIFMMKDVGQRAHTQKSAGLQQMDLAVFDKPRARFARFESDLAQLHGELSGTGLNHEPEALTTVATSSLT